MVFNDDEIVCQRTRRRTRVDPRQENAFVVEDYGPRRSLRETTILYRLGGNAINSPVRNRTLARRQNPAVYRRMCRPLVAGCLLDFFPAYSTRRARHLLLQTTYIRYRGASRLSITYSLGFPGRGFVIDAAGDTIPSICSRGFPLRRRPSPSSCTHTHTRTHAIVILLPLPRDTQDRYHDKFMASP